jgi:ABC-type lipoprotein export system ATPase subunit
MAESIVDLKDVIFSAQNETIVRGVSVQFEEGKAAALVGPSGSGKSTVLKLAAGLLVPASGVVSFRGKDIAVMNRAQNMAFRREAAVVFQDSALWSNQNLNQILDLPLRIHFTGMSPAKREERIREVTEMVGYHRNLAVRPANLSMGEQKLIAFARAMLCHPVLLFLDEWTESLDDDAAQRLVGVVRSFKEEGRTIIFVSHDLRLIKTLADTVIIIVDGQVSRQISGAEIAKDPILVKLVEETAYAL